MIYGVAPGPVIWQRTIEHILQELPGVQCSFGYMRYWKNGRRRFEELRERTLRLSKFGFKTNKYKF